MASKKETKQLAKMASELNTIKQKMSSMSVGPSPPKQGSRRRRNAGPRPYGSSVTGPGKDNASITITRTELLMEVKSESGKATVGGRAVIKPSKDSLPWLSKIADAYSQIEWHSLAIFWKPAVGANSNGRIIYSADVDGAYKEEITGRALVASHYPCLDIQIWQDNEARPMIVPRDQLTSRRRFLLSTEDASDNSPGTILYYASGPGSGLFGELWCRYTVRMVGPR